MTALVRTLIRHIVGWGFVAIGIVGLFLPVLQGVLFIAVGLLVLAPVIPAFGRLLSWAETRFPRLGPVIRRARERVAQGRARRVQPPGER